MRPKLPKPTEETRRAAALLAEELLSWPGVTERPMFGMRCFYRSGIVFAMLPDKRALERPDAIGYKQGGKWLLHTLDDNLNAAVATLQLASEAAAMELSE